MEDDFVHRRHAGSQGPVRKDALPILYKHLLTAQTRFAVALEAGPHRIGDQDEAVAPFHLIGQFLSRRMDVEIITNQFTAGLFMKEGRSDEARFPMAEGRHGIIQMVTWQLPSVSMQSMACSKDALNGRGYDDAFPDKSLKLLILYLFRSQGNDFNDVAIRFQPGKIRSLYMTFRL